LEGKQSSLGTKGFDANILFQSSHVSISTIKVECHLRNNNESSHGKERGSNLRKLVEDRHASYHMNVVAGNNLQREFIKRDRCCANVEWYGWEW